MLIRKKGPTRKRHRSLLTRAAVATRVDPLEPRQLFATTIYVDPASLGPTHDGTAWASAYTDLQTALTAAQNGDTIAVGQGTYKPTTDTNRFLSFQLKAGVHLLGSYAGSTSPTPDARDYTNTRSILSGDIGAQGDNTDNSFHVLTITGFSTGTQIDGFTITAGYASDTAPNNLGGGLYATAARATISHTTFTANFAQSAGGAIYATVVPTLSDSTFTNNAAGIYYPFSGNSNGGACAFVAGTSTGGSVTRCTFTDNFANGSGGAVYLSGGSSASSFTSCTFSNNSALGGGALADFGGANLSACSFTRNTAYSDGGAISAAGSVFATGPVNTVNITSSTFTENAALGTVSGITGDTGGGGAIFNASNSHATVTDATFVRNTAAVTGGAIDCDPSNFGSVSVTRDTFLGNAAATGGALALSSSTQVINSLFAGNYAANNGGAICSTFNITLTSCTLTANSAGTTGGAIYAPNETLYPQNSILWADAAPTFPEYVAGAVTTLFGNSSSINDIQGLNSLTVSFSSDPQFLRPAAPGNDQLWGTPDDDYGDLRPAPDFHSLIIDNGIDSQTPPSLTTTDLLGNPRTVNLRGHTGATVDLGAYEMSSFGLDAGADRPAIAGQSITLAATAANFTATTFTYTWDFNNDGLFDDATGPTPAFNTAGLPLGPHPVAVQVTNATDAALTDTLTVTVYPATVYVDRRATAGTHTGLSWADALPDLAPALAAAVPGQEIRVATGTYLPQSPFPVNAGDPGAATFRLVNNVRVIGGYAGVGAPNPDARDFAHTPSTLFGVFNYHIGGEYVVNHIVTAATGTDPSAVLDGFTVTNSGEPGFTAGAALLVVSASPAIANCTFTATSGSSAGGAAYISGAGANPSFSNCTFSSNSATRGGAVYADGGAFPSFTDSTFSSNSAGVTGGALFASAAAVTLTRCSLLANTAGSGGTAVFLSLTATATVLDSAFVGNTGTAAVISVGPSSQLTLFNDTLTANVSTNATAAAVNLSSSSAAVTLTNSILWNNTAATQLAALDSSHSTVNNSVVQGGTTFPSSNILTADPLFTRAPSPGPDGKWRTADDDFGDLRLTSSSPAIDAGNSGAVPASLTTDLAGAPRIQGPAVDLGAYEAPFVAPTPPAATFATSGTAPEGSATASAAFTNPTGTGPFTYSYDFDNDGTFEITNSTSASATIPSSFLPDGPATLTVHARITGPGGSADYTADLSVTNVAPAATFAASTANVTEGGSASVTFKNAADVPADVNAGLRYSFDFDDDGTFDVTDSASPTAAIPAALLADGPATRTLRGRVADKDGGFTDYTTTVTVTSAAPAAAITGAPASAVVSTQLTLTAAATDRSPTDTAAGFTYAWTATLNGTSVATGTAATFTLTPAATGSLVVTLTVTDKDGATSAPATTAVTIAPAPTPPAATFSAPAAAHEGSTAAAVSFTGQSGTGPYTYSYDFDNDGTFEITNSTASSATIPSSYLSDGPSARTVHGRITGPAGSADYTATITVTDVPPTATLTPAPHQPFIIGDTFAATAAATDPSAADTNAGFTYAWTASRNGTPVASGASAAITFALPTAGDYTLSLTATDKDGLASAPATVAFTVTDHAAPTALIASPPTTAPVNQPLTLSAAVIDPAPGGPVFPLTYHWTATLNGTAVAATDGIQFTVTPPAAGRLVVTLVVTDATGLASAPATADVTVTAPPRDTTPPAAHPISSLPQPAPLATTYTFTVTYTDDVAVNVASLGSADVRVTGPSGYNSLATLLSTSGTGQTVTATYAAPAPGSFWDSADNGAYTFTLEPLQVGDTSNNAAPSIVLGVLPVDLPAGRPTDTTPPTAALTTTPPLAQPTFGAATYTFSVTYTDDVAVGVSSLDGADLRVTGPGGFAAAATLLRADTAAGSATATYAFPAPGGTWDYADNGTYTISLQPSQVTDTSNNFAAAATLGALTVDFVNPDAPILAAQQGTGSASSPNLVVASLALTKPTLANGAIVGGTPLSGTVALKNTGHANMTGTATVTLYLSTDSTASTADTVLKTFTVRLGTLKPGKTTKAAKFTLALPAHLADKHAIVAVVTPSPTESDTLDNARALTSNFTDPNVNLAATALRAKPGKKPTATLTIKNAGTQPFNHTVPIALTFTDTATGQTTALPTITTSLKNLKPNQLKSLNLKLALPTALAGHHGTLTATLDPTNTLGQSNTADDRATANL